MGHTRQVEEVRVLVELVKHGTRSVFDIGRGYNGNGIFGELGGKLGASLCIFKGGNSRRYCRHSSNQRCFREVCVSDLTFARFEKVGMGLMHRLAE